MTSALAIINRHRNVLLIDVILLAALYLLPSFSHLTALPLYKLEPMRIALLIALLFTHRANAYIIALTIPLASSAITGHPEPLKALLMCIEYSLLVAAYAHFVRMPRIPVFAALLAGILLGKLVYYAMKLVALDLGLLSGQLVSTPVQNQLLLALVTAAVFGLVEHLRFRQGSSRP
jgi:hypothetical protein